MVGSMLDVSERRRAQAQDRFLVRLDDAVRPLIEPGEITAAAARLLGQHLGVNRCAYAQVEADRDTFLLTGNYTDGVHSIVGRYGLAQFGQECLRVMRGGEPFVVEDCRTDMRIEPESRKTYEAAAIRALIQVPILKAGQFVAAIAVHTSTPRKWQPEEIELLRRVASRCWESIERARLTRHREELLEAERAARAEAERLGHMKDEFLATLSHELRTPLNAILGWSHLLTSRATSDPGSVQQGAAVIARNARAQARMIEDLLDMSRIISGKVRLDVRPVPLHDIARAAMETVQTSADAKSVQLRLVGDADPGVVSVDPSRVQQVIWNLLSNAVKFTPPGGSVEVSIVRQASDVHVQVRDTGQGIPPEFLPFVFERFRQADASTTRRVGGLGLGLSIVKQLVELHGGRVRAESTGEGQGSVFTVTLPVAGLEPKRVSAPQPPSDPIGPPSAFDVRAYPCDGLAVLVVDDDSDARDLVARVLAECGAKVVTAVSSRNALEALSRESFALLVFDIGMPDEDGYDLIRRVRADERCAAIPAIALTAFARPDDRRRALDAGYDMHVAKPVEPTDLLRACLAAVGRLTSRADRARAN
jgi:signal transduction histidine kinase/CheY-like chemotaxis protein